MKNQQELFDRIELGSRVWFYGESQLYTVRAISPDRRYFICTKPFNLRKTVLYSIMDTLRRWRAPDDRVLCEGYETEEQIAERMRELIAGEIELSHRRGITLTVLDVLPPSKRKKKAA